MIYVSLPREPEKALEVVKNILRERQDVLKTCLLPPEDRNILDQQMLNEIEFLTNLIKELESIKKE